jgi:transcriptional regulator with XRE-family HTH domain
MSRSPAEDLSDRLSALKERDGRSYSALARRTGVSRSSLHRYCQGLAVPDLYGTVERIAGVCGATPRELAELHRLWLRASAADLPGQTAVTEAGPEIRDATASRPVAAPAVPTRTRHGEGLPRRPEARPPGRVPMAIAAVLAPALAAAVTITVAAKLRDPADAGHSPAPAPQMISGPRWSRPPEPVPPAFFGVTTNSRTGDLPTFTIGAVRLWDSGTSWQRLQPRRGVFEWTTLDRHVAAASAARLPVLLTFGATPAWAAPDGPRAPYDDGSRAAPPDDLRDWDNYVRAVGARYSGRIQAYELWNLAPSPKFFTGSPELLAEMTRRAAAILRAADARATIVCPGMGELWEPSSRAFLTRFAAGGGYEPCDVAAVKLYQRHQGDSPESVLELVNLIDDTLRRAGVLARMWNTGTTYRVVADRPLSEARAANYAVRFYLVGLVAQYERMYFYNWGGTKIPIVLQALGGAPTRAALHVEELQRWVRDAEITGCGHGVPAGLPAGVWECTFLLPEAGTGATRAAIRWTETGTVTTTVPTGAVALHHLDHSVSDLRPGTPLRIGEEPVLVRYATGSPARR